MTIMNSMKPLVWHCSNSSLSGSLYSTHGIVLKQNMCSKTVKRRLTVKGAIHTNPRLTYFPSAAAEFRELVTKPFAKVSGMDDTDE